MDNLLTICLNKVEKENFFSVLTTLVLASARTSGMMASVSSAWAASSRRMWVKVPGLSSEDTLLELERVVTMMSASSRSWNECDEFSFYEFRLKVRILPG